MIVIATDLDLNAASKDQTLEQIDLESFWSNVPDRDACMVVYYGKRGGKVLKDRSGNCPRVLKTHQDFLNAVTQELSLLKEQACQPSE